MVPVDPFDCAADCERALQTTQDPERRFVLIKLRDQWIAVGNERSLMTDDEIANDIERLGRIQSELIDASPLHGLRVANTRLDLTNVHS